MTIIVGTKRILCKVMLDRDRISSSLFVRSMLGREYVRRRGNYGPTRTNPGFCDD